MKIYETAIQHFLLSLLEQTVGLSMHCGLLHVPGRQVLTDLCLFAFSHDVQAASDLAPNSSVLNDQRIDLQSVLGIQAHVGLGTGISVGPVSAVLAVTDTHGAVPGEQVHQDFESLVRILAVSSNKGLDGAGDIVTDNVTPGLHGLVLVHDLVAFLSVDGQVTCEHRRYR